MKGTHVHAPARPAAPGVPGTHDASPIAVHHAPTGFHDRAALSIVKLVRVLADAFLSKRHGLRAVVIVIRADEAGHRDKNHFFADEIAAGRA